MNGGSAELLLFGVTGSGQCTGSQLNNPCQIASLNSSMFIADSNNNRVLKIMNINTVMTTIDSASTVIGQTSFTNCAELPYPNGIGFPNGVVIDNNQTLWIADTNNCLVKKYYMALTLGNNPTPNGYLGKVNSVGICGVTQSSFTIPRFLGIDRDVGHLFVTDYIRVLAFRDAQSKENGADADIVFGQPDFTSQNFAGCSIASVNNPGEPFYDSISDTLIVADQENQRVVMWNGAMSAGNGDSANILIGQPTYTMCPFSASLNASNFGEPYGIDYSSSSLGGAGLLVSDYYFERMLRFQMDL
jgi:hypothetical protein